MEYHRIELFLLVADANNTDTFYSELKAKLHDIFNDDKVKKIFEDKWTHSVKSNVMGLFNKIAKDFYEQANNAQRIFSNLYTDTMLRLLKEEKLSRI